MLSIHGNEGRQVPFPVIAPCLKTRTGASGLFPRKWKMTRKTSQRRNGNYNRNSNTRRVAWDDLRAMTPIEPHTDFSKPPIGYVLDDDGNYPENIWEVL